ncbi:NAD(P)/FAD-dependent oxidoreductase [Amphibiibacter pelophylacis]|uniref:FAD-dependent oxidoreductase n=1 Tax=Amphibiibacter pelophylacis TaxID=1799477 RepID=A0ACC6P553_9BURK
MAEHIAIVGAGVIGIACALQLRRAGFEVTVIDPEVPGANTSYGNAGAIAIAEVLPLSTPDTWKRVPKMLLDPLGPLAIQWRCLPRLTPWLLRYLLAGRPQRVAELSQALADLLGQARADTQAMAEAAGVSHLLRHHGGVVLYGSAAEAQRDAPAWDRRRELGVESQPWSPDQMAQALPMVDPALSHGLFVPQWSHVDDPWLYTRGLYAAAQALGVRFEQGLVTGFAPNGETLSVRSAVRGVQLRSQVWIAADQVLLAAGAWAGTLARQLGCRLPLESERGYHVDLPHAGVELPHFLQSHAGSFVILPKRGDGPGALRLAGTVELASLSAPPNWARARVLIEQAQRLFPALRQPQAVAGARFWMGHRPSLPDTLPVVGTVPRHPNVHLALGHGHLGLTLAATTARMIETQIQGRPPLPGQPACRPGRFSGL